MNVHTPMDVMANERLEIVVSSDRLAVVGEKWTRLWRETDALVFQSHDWISAWWTTVEGRQGNGLRIGLAWSGDRLVAVLPLAITRRKGLRILEWAAGAYSDYGDLLRAPDCPDTALRKLWVDIWKTGGFDLALINRLQPDAQALRIVGGQVAAGGVRLQPGHREEISSRIGCGWESGEAWLASHDKKVRKNYRRRVKILGEGGDVQFRLLGPDEPIEPVLDRLAALKREWLEKNALTSDLFEGDAPLLKAFVGVLARAGILRLFVIDVDGVVVAISVNFVQRDRMMVWVPAYDPDFARGSPGMVLIFDYVQWSVDHGLGMVDLLCGGEAFKERLASEVVPLRSVIGARTAKGSLALLAQRVRRKLMEGSAPQEPSAEPA